MRTSVAVVLCVALSGCASASPGPTDVIASYVGALRDQRFTDAYRLLSTDARRNISYEDFERLAREHPDEVRETVRWLSQIDTHAPITAHLELANGDTITLVQEGGAWRLDPSALDFYGQHTPRQTIRSFARALRRRRYDVLLRFVPRRLVQGLTAESLRTAWESRGEADDVQRELSQLEQGIDHPIEVVGDRASMQYGPGGRYVIQLLREDGVWKVEDPD